MGKTKPIFEIKGFRGKNNVADPARILPSEGASFLAECRDADIDNELMVDRSAGFGAPTLPGIGIHSLWSNGDICLFVQGPDLKRLNPDYAATTILSRVGPARMVYVEVAGTGYLTNGTVIGYVREGASNIFHDTGKTYKIKRISWYYIANLNRKLYVARDNETRFSDPMAFMRTDKRKNFKHLPSRVTLLSAVDDGNHVSDLERIYFMGGGDPGEAVLIDKTNYSAISHTAQKIDAAKMGGFGLSGSAVLWGSMMGICLKANGGQFKNLTEDYSRPQGDAAPGPSLIRKKNGFYQFVYTIGA